MPPAVDLAIIVLLRPDRRDGHPPLRPAGDYEHGSGSPFTSFAWTDRLKRVGTRISMDGKGRCLDNIFSERLWQSLKLAVPEADGA